jgi:hypothetical protein
MPLNNSTKVEKPSLNSPFSTPTAVIVTDRGWVANHLSNGDVTTAILEESAGVAVF